MDCKCGAIAQRKVESFDNQRTAEEASGKKIERLPCTVVKDHCSYCGFGAITIWYPAGSRPVKSRSLLDLMRG